MKFVHIADMHFDTSFAQINDSNIGTLRRLEQRKILTKVIDFIKSNDIEYLFIAGDFYEHKFIKESTIIFINDLFKEIPNTKIYITPGNHDPLLKNSFYNTFKWNDNVYIFNSKLTKIEAEDVNIYGFGFDDFYYTNSELDNFELDDRTKPNILITHATLDGSNNVERQYNAISTSLLKQIGFDYVALGHIHKNNFVRGENIIYPGSTIAMGFDELGSHGMVVGEIEEGQLLTDFIPLDDKEFKLVECDVSEIYSFDDLVMKVNTMFLDNNNFYELVLVGKRKIEIDEYKLRKLNQNESIIKIKNNTVMNYELENMMNDYTLKGIFVKDVVDKMNNESFDKELLEQVLDIGLEILDK